MSRQMAIENKLHYAKLLSDTLPRVIHTKQENQRCTAILEKLLAKRQRTPEESIMIELLALQIEDFEEKHYSIPVAAPRAVIRHLMESNDLRQIDLVDIFGTESIVSEVLNGRRDLAKAHIEKLSRYFHVSPDVFFNVKG